MLLIQTEPIKIKKVSISCWSRQKISHCTSSALSSETTAGSSDLKTYLSDTKKGSANKIRVVRENFLKFNRVLSGEEMDDNCDEDPRGFIQTSLSLWKAKFDEMELIAVELGHCFSEYDSNSILQLKRGGPDRSFVMDRRTMDLDPRSPLLSAKSPSNKNVNSFKNFELFENMNEMNRQQANDIEEKNRIKGACPKTSIC